MKIVAVFINIVYLKNTLALINVAYRATGKYCDSIALTATLFDGQTNKDLVAAFTSSCSPNAYIEIQTVAKYFVHYFVMYRGEGPDTGQMAYIRTEIYVYGTRWYESNVYDACTEYYLPTVPYDVGVRTNCPPRAKSDWFKVISHKNEGLYLSEVELNYMGSDAEETWMVYRGCFRSFDGSTATANDIKACAETCMATHSYFAMKITECICGDAPNMADSITLTECGIDCNVRHMKCGGEASYSVYLVNFRLPYYDGCLKRTDITSTLPPIEGDMSPGKCLQYCGSEKLAWISKGNKCQCSTERGNAVFTREGCTSPCTGDNTFTCGSESDDMFSVWRECLNPETHSVKCSDGFMCDGLYNGFGICEGSCIRGFEDPYCLTGSDESETTEDMPSDPDMPHDPDMPTDPDMPHDPDMPTDPDVPTDPDMPHDPDMPPDPDTPPDPDMPHDPDMPPDPDTPPDPDAPSDQGEPSETDETPDPDATPGPEAPGPPDRKDRPKRKKDNSVVIIAAIGGIVLVLGLIIGGFVVLRLCKKTVASAESSVPGSETASEG